MAEVHVRDPAIAIRPRECRILLNDAIEILDRALHVTFVHPRRAESLIRPRHVRRQLDRLLEVDNRCVKILQREPDVAAMVVRLGDTVLDLDGAVQVRERTVRIAHVQSQTATITERLKQVLIERDRAVEIFDRGRRFHLGALNRGAIQIRDCERRPDADRLVQIGHGAFKVAFLITREAPITVGIRDKRIDDDDVAVRRCLGASGE